MYILILIGLSERVIDKKKNLPKPPFYGLMQCYYFQALRYFLRVYTFWWGPVFLTGPSFYCSKLVIKALEQGVKDAISVVSSS